MNVSASGELGLKNLAEKISLDQKLEPEKKTGIFPVCVTRRRTNFKREPNEISELCPGFLPVTRANA